jgi:acetyl esterase
VRSETRAFNEQLRALLATLPATETVPPEVTRRARYEGRGLFPPPVFLPQARSIDADGVRVRVLAPEEPHGVYLHLHGGGWTLGAADLQDESLNTIAASTGLAVASVEYRLAPEHPFPPGPTTASGLRAGSSAAATWSSALLRSSRSAANLPARTSPC